MPRSGPRATLCVLPLILACGAAVAQADPEARLADFFADGPSAPLVLDIGPDAARPEGAVVAREEPGAASDEDFSAPAPGSGADQPAVPLAGGDSDTPVSAIPAAQPAVVPEGWQAHTHFGVGFAVPPGFVLGEVEDSRRGRLATYLDIDQAAGRGVIVTVAFLPPSELADMQQSMFADLGIEFETAAQPVLLGPYALTDRRASGVVAGNRNLPPGPVTVRILSSDTPTAWNQLPVVVMLAIDTDPALAQRIGAGLVGSLSVAGDPAEIGAPEIEGWLDGLVRYRLPPGTRDSDVGAETRWISWREAGAAQDHARIVLDRQPARDFLGDTILESFNGTVTVRAGRLSNQPVWVVEGRPDFDLGSARTMPGDDWRQTSFVMQVCLPERGPAVLSTITTTERIAAGMTPTSMLEGFTLAPPPEAQPCPAPIMASFATAAADPAMVFAPEGPPRPPAVLSARTHFGLTLDLPEGFLTEDHDTDPEGGIGVSFRDPGMVASSFGMSGLSGSLVTLRFEPPAQRDATMARTAAESGIHPQRQPDTVSLLGTAFADWRGQAMVMAGLRLRFRVLTHDQPGPNGWVPVIGLLHANLPDSHADAFEAAVLAGLRPAVPGQPIGVVDLAVGSDAARPPVAPLAIAPGVEPGDPVAPPVAGKPSTATLDTPSVTADSPEARVAAAMAADDVAGVIGYLEHEPAGALAVEARAWLDRRAIVAPPYLPASPGNDDTATWQRAQADGTPDAMFDYLSRWPLGAHADEARDWLSRRAIMVPPSPGAPPAAGGNDGDTRKGPDARDDRRGGHGTVSHGSVRSQPDVGVD